MCADFCSVCAYTPGNVTLAVQIFVQLRRVNRLKSFDHKKRQTVRVHLTQRFPYGEKKNPIKIILLRLSTFWLSLESGVKKKKVSTFSKDEHWLKTRGGIRKRKKNKVEKSREEEDVFSEQKMKRKKKIKTQKCEDGGEVLLELLVTAAPTQTLLSRLRANWPVWCKNCGLCSLCKETC